MGNNHTLLKIDLNHLLVFNKIAESRNLTDAARVLGQDKTRLSRILSDLETTLGVELIYRTTRQFRLSEAGEQLYQKSREQIASLQTTANEFLSQDGKLQGHIRLTGAHGVFARLISPIITEFSRRHPEVTFEIIFAQQSLDLVKEGIDLAVRMGIPKESSLKMRKVGEFTAIFGASPQYLRTHAAPLSFEDLAHHRLLMLESLNKKNILLTDGRESQTLHLKGFIASNGPDVLLNMALDGLGIGLLPEILYRNHIQTREIIPLFPGWRMTSLPVCLLFAYKKQQPTHIKAFADFLAERFQRILASTSS